MIKKFISSTILVSCLAFSAQAQDNNATIEEQIPDKILNNPRDKVLSIVIENDLLGGKGTDENYTSGVRLTYLDINADLPWLASKIDNVIPTFEINDTSSVTYSIGQNIYTPSNIERRIQDPNDRPWAAHLYGSIGLITVTDNHLDEVELSLGVVGPSALGESAQKFVHKYISTDSSKPLGWSNQLEDEPTIGIGWVRRYPKAFHKYAGDWAFSASPYFGLTAGNVHTFANTGFDIRLAPKSEEWQDTPARVRPALPGTGFFEIPTSKWSWYLFGGVEGRAVARNIFLDGSTFRESHSVDKKNFVYDANAGLALTYDAYRLSYTLVHRSKEFDGQDDPSLFGTISLGYRF